MLQFPSQVPSKSYTGTGAALIDAVTPRTHHVAQSRSLTMNRSRS